MYELDRLDNKILFELDSNSRQSVSQLTKRLRQGRDRVDYRVQRLLDRKIIKRFTTAVNLYKLGFCIYKTYLRLENNKTKIAEFVKYLSNHPRVYWIALCDGRWDMMLAVFARSPKEYHNTHVEILSAFNSIVLDFRMYTMVDMWVFQKGYLVGKSNQHMIVGGEPEQNSIDSLDYRILKSLSNDSRKPLTELADKLKSSSAVVKYRINRLEEKGIITGYPIELDLSQLGMLFFKSQFYLRDYKRGLREKFIQYCMDKPQITFCIRQLGDCTLEIETEVNDYAEYNLIIEEIRGEFSKLIRNFQSVLIRKSHFNWVPGDLEVSTDA